MKRDWDIIRAVLLRLEEDSRANAVVNANAFGPAFAEQEVAYNLNPWLAPQKTPLSSLKSTT